jgi:hypothetical protein
MSCRSNNLPRPVGAVILLAFILLCVLSASASALPGAGWEATTKTRPTNLEPGGRGLVEIEIFNIGAGIPDGKLTVTDVLPAGLTALDAGEMMEAGEEGPYTGTTHGIVAHDPGGNQRHSNEPWECTGTHTVTCTSEPGLASFPIAGGGAGGGQPIQMAIAVEVESGLSGTFPNQVTVVGGGAVTPASVSRPITVSSTPRGFGFSDWDVWFGNEDGTIDTQAGSHPYSASFAFYLATAFSMEGNKKLINHGAGGDVNSIEVSLPPGLVADSHAVPQCTRAQLNDERCPGPTQVGLLNTAVSGTQVHFRVYNMVPPTGMPLELGWDFFGIPVFLGTTVRTGSDYGVTTPVNNIPQRGIENSIMTLWGYPADSGHDFWRNQERGGCGGAEHGGLGECSPSSVSAVTPKPFLTLPTTCSRPQAFTIHADTWQNTSITSEASIVSHDSDGNPAGFTGCEHLGFQPAIKLAPDTSYADTPAGLTVEVKPPVGGLTEVTGLSTSDVQNTKVVLPVGVAINPGQAAGLQACQESQSGVGTLAPAACPSASKVGTVSIETPLLTQRLEGNVYVLQSNPPNLRLLVAASAEGVNLKLIGDVHLDEATGQLTTTFSGTPELPFTDFKLSFSGGAQAALSTPAMCGPYTATSDFTPWSAPFLPDSFAENSFQISSGTNGSACPGSSLPFDPSLIAGSTTDQAGGFTDFSLLLQAPDDQQRIEKLQFKVPQGLLGMIGTVPLCGEPQVAEGTCPSASQIGHTVVAAGPGPYPLVVPQPGQPPAAIYLTGPYKGAPFGLAIVVPLVVGPFTLQTQVVRAKIEVDQLTAQITVTTDPFPQIIDGIPTDLRTINAVIDRPGFMFNPTNCSPSSFSGTAWSTPPPGVNGSSSTAAISSPFQMGSCRSLLFKPDFKVSTSGKTSRKNGASLDAKIVYPRGLLGANQASSQSNLKSVKVDLPKQLPSRLTTLQKACTSQVFEANPANCPADSRVGTASAITPVLPVELTGPAYFVSYGGAKFPELVFALQGYGVTIYIHGETFINKAGITSSTFHKVPDVPIYQFELKLPEGPFSALAANGNLCATKLKLPTSFTAQDSAVINQSTPISVTGCAKAKAKKKSKGKTGKRHPAGERGKKR